MLDAEGLWKAFSAAEGDVDRALQAYVSHSSSPISIFLLTLLDLCLFNGAIIFINFSGGTTPLPVELILVLLKSNLLCSCCLFALIDKLFTLLSNLCLGIILRLLLSKCLSSDRILSLSLL